VLKGLTRLQSGMLLAIVGCIVFSFLSFEFNNSVSGISIDPNIESCTVNLDQSGQIVLSHPDPDVNIYFTLNGTDPLLSGELYSNPLDPEDLLTNVDLAYVRTGIKWKRPIDVTQDLVVIRFRGLKKSEQWGSLRTRTFPINDLGELDVVSITISPDALFDPDTGICVTGNAFLNRDVHQEASYAKNDTWWIYPGNYSKRGEQWEREASFEYFATDGRSTSANIGVRVNGNFTRAFADRSLRLLFKEPQEFSFFGADGLQGHEALILRNSGNDRHKTRLRDAFITSVAGTMDLEVQAYKPVSLYINGVYWGLYNLRERLDDEYFLIHFGVPKNEVAILEDMGVIYRGEKKDSVDFFNSIRNIEALDMSDPISYAEVKKFIDVDNYIDHLSCELFFANQDWPTHNVKIWRKCPKEGEASIWRWTLNDMDLGGGYLGTWQSELDMFAHIQKASGPTARLFKALLGSEEFVNDLRLRMFGLLDDEFSSEYLISAMQKMELAIASEMPRQIERWRYPANMKSWYREMEVLKIFCKGRPEFMLRSIKENLN